MNVLIVEEALESQHGHWFQYLRDMVEDGRAAGHRVDVLGHQNACPEIRRTLGAHPVLRRSVWQNNSERPRRWARIRSLIAHNRSLFEDVAAWAKSRGERYDLTIFPTVRIDHLWALHRLACHHRSQLGRLVAIFPEAQGSWNQEGKLISPRSSFPLSVVMRWVGRAAASSHILFATESIGLIRQYEAFCGLRLSYLPHTTSMPEHLVWKDSGKKVLDFGLFGFMRYDKGADLLHQALHSNAFKPQQKLNLHVQWTGDYKLPNGELITQDQQLASQGKVNYIPPFKTSEEYHTWLTRIDAMILPYREGFYKDKLSRVAIDAALVGLPMVYPRRTWLESFVEEFGAGVPFEPASSDSLAEAVCKLAEDHRRLVNLALERRNRVRDAFSGRHFFNLLSDSLESGYGHL